MLRPCLALTTAAALLASGCGNNRPWPKAAVSAADPAIAQTVSVDILPVDLAVWTAPGVSTSGGQIRSQLETHLLDATLATLGKRAYGIGATIDWNGQSGGVDVMARQDVMATVGALAHYGDQAPQGELPLAALPSKLGESTGADATLYLGGWALVTPPKQDPAAKIAGDIAFALVVVAAVVVVAMILEGGSKHSDKKKSGGAAIHEDRDEAITSARDHRSATPARDHRSSSSSSSSSPEVVARDHPGGDTPRPRTHSSLHLSWGADLIEAVAWHPEPKPDAESGLYLEMTLVDNKTGHVLWHAHQWFPADAAKPADADRAAQTLLASLPTR